MQRLILGRVRTTLYRRSGNTKRDKVAMDFSFLAGALEKKKTFLHSIRTRVDFFHFLLHTPHTKCENVKRSRRRRDYSSFTRFSGRSWVLQGDAHTDTFQMARRKCATCVFAPRQKTFRNIYQEDYVVCSSISNIKVQ